MANDKARAITIDHDRCMGSGVCAFYAPQTFDLDDDSHSIVIDPYGDSLESVRAAADGCPTSAINLAESDDHAT